MKFPTFAQWKQLPRILNRAEKIALLAFVLAALVSAWTLIDQAYLARTVLVAADKGSFTEGIIGTPRFLNPLYADSNDTDRDISQLLYSGIMSYDSSGKLAPDLAQSYSVSDDGLTFEFILKDKLLWSDGQPLTSDDILYTISLIQDPAYKSPLRGQWLGVQTEKITDTSFRLKLKDPSASFLENCALKILPKHIWENISADDFPLSPYNLSPVGSGPYSVKKTDRNKDGDIVSIELSSNTKYYGQKPHIQNFVFAFFGDSDSLLASFRRGIVKGFAQQLLPDPAAASLAGASTYSFFLPRYFALFFNSDNKKALDDIQVRQALNLATNKQEIIDQALDGAGTQVDSPILPDFYHFSAPTVSYGYNIEQARQTLDKAGYALGSDGIRTKSVNRKPAFQFTKNLATGSTLDPDVKELQKCLVNEVVPGLAVSGKFGADTKDAVNKFQQKYHADILDPSGLTTPTGDVKQTTRDKLNAVCFPSGNQTIPLHFTLTTVDQPTLAKVAQIIKAQWQTIGVSVDIKTEDIDALERDSIKPRNYEILLFGEVLGSLPDPFPFWHSSQKADPGLNFSLYQNADADKALSDARQSLDANSRASTLELFQNILLKDAPAVFLYDPTYVYVTSGEVKGIQGGVIADPSNRFNQVEQWYTQQRRAWK